MMMIRSQDKRAFVPIGSLTIAEWAGKSTIESTNSDMSVMLGHYASDSRCIEILDEIQKTFKGYTKIQNPNMNSDSGWNVSLFDQPKVYEMPEK